MDSMRSFLRRSNFLLADGADSLLEEPILEAFLVMKVLACDRQDLIVLAE